MNRRTVIAMGSNIGDRLDYLQGGLDGLFDTPRITFLAVSPVYETTPVGGPEQPDYLNAVRDRGDVHARAGRARTVPQP